ncbi:hypothetical protein [Bosea sp. LjRoot237]|uniref:hypothetical protein n=1 Tax=Bosea sp. LjRoot237 TaxID=3342292 RepID=UPI003ECCA6CE
MTSIENLELRLDNMAAEALRREAHRLDLANAGREERAAVMASTRAKVARWRADATAGAVRPAAATARPA